MRRISALLIAGVLCGTWGLYVGTAAADTCKQQLSDTAAASTCEGELGWSYDPASRTFGDGSVTASAKANDPYEYKQDYACGANSTNPGSAIGCSKAFDCPTRLDVDGQPMRGARIVTFRKLKDDRTDPWRPTNTGVCMYTGKTIPMSAVVDAAREHIEKEVGRPSIIAQPPGGVTLVNFTSLFHAPEQTITSLEITDPVQGRISATPQYTWDLGDGITAEGSGHPYDQGVDPKSPASDDYYVKAVYNSPGLKDVYLTLTWQASITLGGSGAIPLDPIVFKTKAQTTAKTATARLYAR